VEFLLLVLVLLLESLPGQGVAPLTAQMIFIGCNISMERGWCGRRYGTGMLVLIKCN